ncbi:hypothetical protein FA95DRAFT_777138 [Auriscalpium vulgare]|uniref:Uncharacterized protein n=1 Tax=Auriscalpium vulgare TaxID=40419 RepID=A0ACB8S146_9AGAM|nr:hypothetical protein FA95DRAFT_777138 [Auriscalpium vulgare]
MVRWLLACKVFGFSHLAHRFHCPAIEATMGERCDQIEWVVEGGVSQMYLACLESGREVLARLKFPFPHGVLTGEAFATEEDNDRPRVPYRILVEHETMRYVRTHTTVPVPEVYGLLTDLTNPVGTPCALQEKLPGSSIDNVFYATPEDVLYATPAARLSLVRSVGNAYGQLLALRFDSFGSISKSSGSQPIGPLTTPLCTIFREHPLTDRGPWPESDPLAPLTALAVREDLGSTANLVAYSCA